jgi:uncharacterized sulfatase
MRTMWMFRLLCTALAVGLLCADAFAERRPNVLMIVCDDLNTDLGAFGVEAARTPHMDRLAVSGTRFAAAFAQFGNCMPSRYSFLSGWSPLRTGMHDFSRHGRDGALAAAVYLPEHFRANGYVTARLDKVFHIGRDVPGIWDVSEEPLMKEADGTEKHVWTGIEIPVLGLEEKVVRSAQYREVTGEDGRTQVMDDALPEDALFDGRTARRARELLREFAGGEKPFFLAVGFRRPHLPWIAHQRYFDLFPADAMRPVAQPGTEAGLSPDIRRAMMAHYFAAVTSVDHHVGTLLDELARTGQDKNTIVVLFGDHGYALGERENRYGKGVMWDRALQTPLLVRVPGERTAPVVETPVGLLDVYPTLVELAGLPWPATPLDGRSLVGLLRGTAPKFPDRVYSYYRWAPSKFPEDYVGPERNAELIRSVRTARYRYTEFPGGRNPELIDVQADPYGWRNLAADPAHAAVVAELKTLLAIER